MAFAAAFQHFRYIRSMLFCASFPRYSRVKRLSQLFEKLLRDTGLQSKLRFSSPNLQYLYTSGTRSKEETRVRSRSDIYRDPFIIINFTKNTFDRLA